MYQGVLIYCDDGCHPGCRCLVEIEMLSWLLLARTAIINTNDNVYAAFCHSAPPFSTTGFLLSPPHGAITDYRADLQTRHTLTSPPCRHVNPGISRTPEDKRKTVMRGEQRTAGER